MHCPNRLFYKTGLPDCSAKITYFMKAYHVYLRVKLGNQDKSFANHIYCKTCVENLQDFKGTRKEAICYLWPIRVEGRETLRHRQLRLLDKSNRHHYQQQTPSSTPWCSFCHNTSPSWPRATCQCSTESSSDPEFSITSDSVEFGAYKTEEDYRPVPLTQAEVNDLITDLLSYWDVVSGTLTPNSNSYFFYS